MPRKPAPDHLVCIALLCVLNSFCEEPPQPAPKSEAAVLVKEGRAHFGKAQYTEAFRAFERALDKDPSSKDTRVLAAVSAYWARRPERALEYWEQLYLTVERGSNEEWELQKNRVMALSALNKWDAVELGIVRLKEIRAGGKSPAARSATGFVREHFFGKGMRAGFWEAFDDRGESPALWSITVSRDVETPPQEREKGQPATTEKTIATLAVEAAALPGGGTGYVFSEETEDVRRIYKHWTSRPDYAAVRTLSFAVLRGTADPISEKPLNIPAAGGPEPLAGVPVEIKALGLTAQAEAIALLAFRLNYVRADVSRLSRISNADAAGFEEYMREFNTKYPRAAVTASELTEEITKASPATLTSACDAVLKFPGRSAYLELSLLTSLNTRNRDIPPRTLNTLSKSKDAIVRQMAAYMLARAGQKPGIELLFSELESADPRGAELVMGWLDLLLGHVIESPPNAQSADAAAKLPAWKQVAAKWHAENIEKLEHVPDAKDGDPVWVKK